ncbi:SoxR reducing system protein RseC [Pectobacterium brasiliense]|uniref:SoxR-reducing system protein RseC n=1 Tax=Pectobacterium brasiliense TaxID=180957 RepID=UPI0004E6FD79|nr:SoxR-reducing system protein RseC [Pectobacterium brasiliense]KFF61127.1 SoxR reducing system protein RseC [Pectobacterium brasiliense]
MIKEWATVVAWQDGIAELRCEPSAGCGSCKSRSSCGTGLLSQLGLSTENTLYVPYDRPLEVGQKVELGISEGRLLFSAALVYFVPLVGLLIGAAICQTLFGTDLAAVIGALLGGGLAFIGVKRWAKQLGKNKRYEPVILQIALPGTLLQN